MLGSSKKYAILFVLIVTGINSKYSSIRTSISKDLLKRICLASRALKWKIPTVLLQHIVQFHGKVII